MEVLTAAGDSFSHVPMNPGPKETKAYRENEGNTRIIIIRKEEYYDIQRDT